MTRRIWTNLGGRALLLLAFVGSLALGYHARAELGSLVAMALAVLVPLLAGSAGSLAAVVGIDEAESRGRR